MKKISTLLIVSVILQGIVLSIGFTFHKDDVLMKDQEVYLAYAENMHTHTLFAMEQRLGSDMMRTPLYPAFIYLFRSFSTSLLPLFVAQIILGTIATGMVYYIARAFISHTAAWIAALLFTIETEHLILGSIIRTEQLFMVLWLGAIIVFINYLRATSRHALRAGFIGLLFGLAVLTRPVLMYMPLIVCVIAIIPHVRPFISALTTKRIAVHMAVMVCVFTLVITPWIIRNGVVVGTYRFTSVFPYIVYRDLTLSIETDYLAQQGLSRIELKAHYLDALKQAFDHFNTNPQIHFDNFHDFLFVLISPHTESFFYKKSFSLFLSHPWFSLKRIAAHKIAFFIDSGFAYNLQLFTKDVIAIPPRVIYPYLFWAGRFWWIALYILIASVCIIYPTHYFSEQRRMMVFFLIIIFYFSLLSVYPSTRLRYPINPFLYILVADAMSVFWYARIKNKKTNGSFLKNYL